MVSERVHRRRETAVVLHPLADLLLRYARQAHCTADADRDRPGREAHVRGGQGGGQGRRDGGHAGRLEEAVPRQLQGSRPGPPSLPMRHDHEVAGGAGVQLG